MYDLFNPLSFYSLKSNIILFSGQYEVKDNLLHDSVKIPFSSFKSTSKRQMAPDPPKVILRVASLQFFLGFRLLVLLSQEMNYIAIIVLNHGPRVYQY